MSEDQRLCGVRYNVDYNRQLLGSEEKIRNPQASKSWKFLFTDLTKALVVNPLMKGDRA